MTEHPITPPPELVQKWATDSPIQANDDNWAYELYIAHHAAQYGADQELDDCCTELINSGRPSAAEYLRTARRPEPQTLNSIALQMLGTIERMNIVIPEITETIRQALEQADD